MSAESTSPFEQVHEEVQRVLAHETPKVKPGGLFDRLAFRTVHGKGIRREIKHAIIDTPDNFLSEPVAERLADVTEGRLEIIWMKRRGVEQPELLERERVVKDNLQEGILRDAVRNTNFRPTLQDRLLLAEGPIWDFAGILAQALASQKVPEALTWRTFFETKVLMPFFRSVTKK